MMSNSDEIADEPLSRWFFRGMRAAFSIPGLILCSAFVGFAGLAKAAGLTLAQSVFMVGAIWALPGMVVLVGAIAAGASLPAAAFAVALSSIRLMPMVVALAPELRGPKTRKWVLYVLAHFVAVTSWVLAMDQLRRLPRYARTTYYAGLGSTLTVGNMIIVGLTYRLTDNLPASLMAALLMLTPVYFLTSLWGSARERASHVAMILGLIIGPLSHIIVPGFELLVAGVIGGGLAFAWHKSRGAQP